MWIVISYRRQSISQEMSESGLSWSLSIDSNGKGCEMRKRDGRVKHVSEKRRGTTGHGGSLEKTMLAARNALALFGRNFD